MRTHFGLCLALVALLTTAALAPALAGQFLWDDESLIVENRSVHEPSYFADWFRASLFSERDQLFAAPSAVQYWRPLPMATFALDWWIGAGSSTVFHATNLALYAALIVAVGWTLWRYTDNKLAVLIALLLFALHPTHVESAGWISGRMDLLILLAILLSLGALHQRLRGRSGFLWLELACAVLAYLSKETAALLPIFALVEAAVTRKVQTMSRATICQLMRDIAPQMALMGMYLLWRWFGLPPAIGHASTSAPLTRAAIFLETLGRAASLTVLPFPQRAQQGLFALDAAGTIRTDPLYVALGGGILTGLALLALLLRRHQRGLLALVCIVASLVPVSNLFASGVLSCFVFERYLLLPHLGCAWLVALLLNRQGEDPQRRKLHYLPVAIALLLVPLFGWRAQSRAEDYANSERFWRHELAYNSLSSLAPAQLSTLADTPRDRLNWLSRCADNASQRRQFDDADRCLLIALETVANALPDSQTHELSELAHALSGFLDGSDDGNQPALANIAGLSFNLPWHGPRRARILASRPGRIESDLALIHSRLGEHAPAQRAAELALSRCARCRWSIPLASVFATAKQFDRARAILQAFPEGTPDLDRARRQTQESRLQYERAQASQGPLRLHALAQSYLALGRFGLALDVLQPEEQAITESRDVAFDYALIAARAGHFEVARRALAKHAPPEVIDRILIDWEKEQPPLK
ncbi:MAG: tetratricopeptide repeat protein [Myxococcales bacterium]